MQQMGPNAIAILSAAPEVARNHDHMYMFRQNSDFHYLTGFNEPEAIMVLLPEHKEGEFILFNRVRDKTEEIWNGHRAGQKGACREFGADRAFPIQDFAKKLPELLKDRDTIYYAIDCDAQLNQTLINIIIELRGKIRSGAQSSFALIDIADILHEMRLFKSPTEIALLKKAGQITADAHIRAMQYCRPGLYEYELEAEITHEFIRQGARFHAYTPIIGSGANTCILHYVTNHQRIKKTDLVLVDAGAEYQYYAADVTRTFPANGRFSAEQRAVYDIVLEAQLAGIKAIRPGTAWNKIEEITVKIITQGLKDIGLLKGNLDSLIEKQAYLPFYMHRSGHWLGLDTHDAGVYKINHKWRPLKSGMVRTVEPGIYISANTPNVPKRWHHIGIRIEDDILVTKTGYEVLSDKAPKRAKDIESLMSR
ncbi:Xaa-Pro aminopeptidase [Gammaproteobacteria bacterium SCGC AG-212-F23]|nr:Xaa-Pro aminopeptidase [Gammaproteobacteria bacterium SCGC AG-212-F23]